MLTQRNQARTAIFRTVLILIVIITAGAITTAFYVQQLLTNKTDARFTHDTQLVTQNILDHVAQHNVILYNAKALIVSSDSLTQHSWNTYFDAQKTFETNKGINSISYAEVVPYDQKQAFESKVRAEGALGDMFTIYPEDKRDKYVVARLVAAKSDVSKGYGFDNYSTPERRETYLQAEAANHPQASPPITFATGSLGFFVTLPVIREADKTTHGFIIMSFHVSDFLAFIPETTPSTIAIKITDITDTNYPIELFKHPRWDTTAVELTRRDQIIFAGRTWNIDFASPRAYEDMVLNFAIPRIILATAGGLVLCLVFGYFIYQRHAQAK